MTPTLTIEEITTKLEQFESDPNMVTKGAYSPSAIDYPDNQYPFVQVHLAYLKKHHRINAAHYISNLEIMIKQR